MTVILTVNQHQQLIDTKCNFNSNTFASIDSRDVENVCLRFISPFNITYWPFLETFFFTDLISFYLNWFKWINSAKCQVVFTILFFFCSVIFNSKLKKSLFTELNFFQSVRIITWLYSVISKKKCLNSFSIVMFEQYFFVEQIHFHFSNSRPWFGIHLTIAQIYIYAFIWYFIFE